jgi:hypothetical protein
MKEMWLHAVFVAYVFNLDVQALKISGRPCRLARESEKLRERGRRKEKWDGNRIAMPISCPFCSPCRLRHFWPSHISLRLNLVAVDPVGSGGSSRSERAVRSKGRCRRGPRPCRRKRERENGGGAGLESHRDALQDQACLVVKCYSVVCVLGFLLLPALFLFFFLFLFLQEAHVYPCFLAGYGIASPHLMHA